MVENQAMQVCNLQPQIMSKVLKQINIKPTPGTAPGTLLSAEVSYFFVSLSVGLPTLINWKTKTHI